MAPNDAADGAAPGSSRLVWVIVAIATGLGLTVAAGSVFDGAGGTAGVGEVIPRALVGALVGVACAIVALVCLRRWAPRASVGVGTAAMVVTVVASLGALTAIGLMPGDEIVATSDADSAPRLDVPYRTRTGDVARGVVAPIDLDGDDRPDAVDGQAVVGFDADGDGVEDGRLSRCRSTLGADVPPDSIAINSSCSPEIEVMLPYDSSMVLVPAQVSEPLPPPSRRDTDAGGDVSDVQGTIVLLIGLGLVLLALRFFANQVQLVPIEPDSLFLEGRAFIESEEPDTAAVVAALERSIESLRGSGRPRDAILAAYATLLDELDAVGLGRRSWEAPVEHCRRCLREARLAEGPIDALVDLFSRARFGGRPMTDADRDAALEALADSVQMLRAQMLDDAPGRSIREGAV